MNSKLTNLLTQRCPPRYIIFGNGTSTKHAQTEWHFGMPPACAEELRPYGLQAHDALTLKLDHPLGARQMENKNPDVAGTSN